MTPPPDTYRRSSGDSESHGERFRSTVRLPGSTNKLAPAHYQSLEDTRVTRIVSRLIATRGLVRILDYGCGRGRYLQCFRDLGCETTAVDANVDYVNQARARGFAAYCPSEFLASPVGPFDVVLLSHVIEHLTPTELTGLIPKLCKRLHPNGLLVIVTPVPGERFYHDLSHVRPYLPQSIRQAFGQGGGSFVHAQRSLVELVDIYFFRDPFKTRMLRAYYVGRGWRSVAVRTINLGFDALWRLSGGRVGRTASWLGIYRVMDEVASASQKA